MAKGIRELRRRIKSIQSTRKITKAMELVSAAKMRKAINSVLATRDYANLAWATILHLAEKTDPRKHALLKKRTQIKRVALILISSNRGLCGSFNMQVAQKAIRSIKKHEMDVKSTDIISFGARGRDIIRSFGYNIKADFPKQDITLKINDISAIAQLVINEFKAGIYDKVFVVFTDFVSSMQQVARVKQLLPIEAEPDEYLGVVGKSSGIAVTKEFIKQKEEKYLQKGEYSYEYKFEPSPAVVLEQMLPRLIEMQIYQSVLETEASEHSARMLAMKNASEAAADMIFDLTLLLNRVRQAGITQEIAEITSGAAALT